MNRQTYVSQAIKTDFDRRLAAVTDPARRARIEAMRAEPLPDIRPVYESLEQLVADTLGFRPTWELANGHRILVLPNIMSSRLPNLGFFAHLSLDRPSAKKLRLNCAPMRLGHLHLKTFDLEDLDGHYPDIARFSERDAERFWAFVGKMRAVGVPLTWIISCEKGLSRSAACAVALARWMGDEAVAEEISDYYIPNQHILGVLESARKSFGKWH